MTPSSLAGKRIVITRPPHKTGAFAAQLRDLGAEPILLPTIELQPPADPVPLDRALSTLACYDWLIVTSTSAVTQLWRRFEILGIDSARLDWPAVAVIGPATRQTLEEHGIKAALMPEKYIAEALFETLSHKVDLNGARILLPQGNLARPVLADLLRGAGANMDTVVAYETVKPNITRFLEPFDAVTFTSASTAENFVEMFDDPLSVIGSALVACIGPITAEMARELGLPVHVIAEPYTIEGLIAVLSQSFERKPIP